MTADKSDSDKRLVENRDRGECQTSERGEGSRVERNNGKSMAAPGVMEVKSCMMSEIRRRPQPANG